MASRAISHCPISVAPRAGNKKETALMHARDDVLFNTSPLGWKCDCKLCWSSTALKQGCYRAAAAEAPQRTSEERKRELPHFSDTDICLNIRKNLTGTALWQLDWLLQKVAGLPLLKVVKISTFPVDCFFF